MHLNFDFLFIALHHSFTVKEEPKGWDFSITGSDTFSWGPTCPFNPVRPRVFDALRRLGGLI